MKEKSVRRLVVPVILVLLIYSIPTFVQNQYVLRVCVYICIYSILACSLNLISGVCGQVSMGHAAFYGIGAYASSLTAMRFGVPWIVAVLASAVVAGMVGLFIGIPALKLQGGYLVICTVGFGELVRLILLNWVSLTRGPMGITNIPRPEFLGITIKTGQQYLYLMISIFLLIYIILNRINYSKFGRNLRAIKEDETAAEAMGIHVHKEKVIAFAVAAAMAGVAGALLAHYMLFISPSIFIGDFSTTILSMVVLGGMGNMTGSVISATLLTIIPEALRWLDKYRMLIYGFLLIIMMLGKNVSWEEHVVGKYLINIHRKIKTWYVGEAKGER